MALHLPAAQQDDGDTCNLLVMSAAGKPIYARHGTDDEIGRICGLVQALRSSIASMPSLGGDIRSLRSGKLCITFMSVFSLTLVAIGMESDTEAYLKLQLEYVYCQIIFTVTERVQDQFAYDPGFDLRSMLGAADTAIIDSILDNSSPMKNPGPSLLGSIETIFPMPPAVRARASRALQATGLKTDFTAFAILAAGNKLVTMITPAAPDYQMRVADLHLLLNVVNRQPLLLSSELWIPVCLPLFSSKDFLFCYTQCWDEASRLCLILVSQQSTTQQFQLFKEASANIRRSLDLPPPDSTVLEILDSHPNNGLGSDYNQLQEGMNGNATKVNAESSSMDVKWRRNEEDPNLDEDYDTVSYGDLDAVLPYLPSPARVHDSVFLREVRAASRPERLQGHMEHYLAIGSALHFLFRMEVPLSPASSSSGRFAQSVTSPLGFPFSDAESKRRVWTTYQKLRLRLCRRVEDDCFANSSHQSGFAAISQANTSPADADERLTFVMEETEIYIAMKGKDYEFYTVLPSTTSLKEATMSATRLVRRLFADQRSLFLYHPMTWDV